jgi:pyridoxamine 5'-phosphate oxidase
MTPPRPPWCDAFEAWFEEAKSTEPDVPDAMQVATVDPAGRPSLRTVLLKGWDEGGLVFYTNTGSRKGHELATNVHVAALLHWKSLQRQAIFEGAAEPVTPAEADAYWATRPRGSQLGGWASHQSEAMTDRAELLERLAAAEARWQGVDVPRPPHWSGYRVVVDRVELWQGRRDRLHERRSWTHDGDAWIAALLQP